MIWIAFAGKELLRKKVVLVAIALTLVYLTLFCYGLTRMAQEGNGDAGMAQMGGLIGGMILMSLGLLFAGMIVTFLVLFATMGTISGEVENGLMLAVLARPIPRWKLYLGKYLGTGFWLVVYSTVLFFAILLPVHFIAHMPLYSGAMLKAWLLFIWMPLLLLALTMLGSVYLPMLGNGVACAMLYGMSMFTGFAETLFNASGGNEALSSSSLILSLVMPINAVFSRLTYEIINGPDLPLLPDMANAMGPFSPTNVPSPAFIVYTVVYLVVLLALGCRAFKRKEIA
ncbi:ABC transporter permease [Paenibacillus sp. R14(2021)]|uniref:ABC transporter permease n=1 Tax=Paenibacillus sp. R14(2021) TaxID=2859228 RepID=UPI001C6137B0|nr:ABC transporter permease subunit [Paenibacillus sp. R14(2021)]